jgi:hypothetical protein
MSRNVARIKQQPDPVQPIPQQPLTYSPPTTHITLPSRGDFYPPAHPLHGEDTIEVKHMTTREEEILTSQALIQKGLVVDRLLESVVLNKEITPDSLLVGDKNAILVGLRIDAYGEDYTVDIPCPMCGSATEQEINLSALEPKPPPPEDLGDPTENGTFIIELPRTGAKLEIRPLTGADEKKMLQAAKKAKKYNLEERHLTSQYKNMIVSVNGDENPIAVTSFIENMPAFDSRLLRQTYKKINPDLDMSFTFQCGICDHEQGMEVPVTANFFWSE